MSMKSEVSRITIDIPKASHKRLKAMAAILGKSMRELVVESIEEHLEKTQLPNKQTLKAIEKVEKRTGLVKAKNAKELFEKLGI